MSIKKRDLLDFLDAVERKAIRSVRDKHEVTIKEIKEEKLMPYMAHIESYQRHINHLINNINDIIGEMSIDLEVAYPTGTYGSVERELLQFKGQRLKNRIVDSCNFKGEVMNAKNNRDKEIEEVMANYGKVRQVCISLPSGNKVAAYLKGLGFDISNLEKEEELSLVADIDKSKLFVCGDNK